MTACAHPPARCADIACRERKVCMYAVEVAPVGASDPVSRDGEGGSEVHEVKPSPPTEHHKNSESLRMTPSPSSEGQDLAALSERLRAIAAAQRECAERGLMGHLASNYERFEQAADAISSLLKEAEGLKAELKGAEERIEELDVELDGADLDIKSLTEELSAATKRVGELERVCSDRLVRLDEALKRAEAAEGALGELHAMVWGEAPHLLDEDRGGSARLDLEIEAILNRPRALTGEGAER